MLLTALLWFLGALILGFGFGTVFWSWMDWRRDRRDRWRQMDQWEAKKYEEPLPEEWSGEHDTVEIPPGEAKDFAQERLAAARRDIRWRSGS